MFLPNILKQLFSGRVVRIVGSAPSGPLSNEVNTLNVFVNGAIGRCGEVEGTKIGFVNEQLFSNFVPDILPVKKTIDIICQNSSKLDLIILSPSNPYFADKEALEAVECKVIRIGLASSHKRMARTLKSKYLPSFPDGMVSTGIRAVLMAFSFGAKSVKLDGFSLKVPKSAYESHHYYDPSSIDVEQKPRHHSAPDSAAIALLSLRGLDLETDSDEFSTLFHSFGMPLPSKSFGSNVKKIMNTLLFRGWIPDLLLKAVFPLARRQRKKYISHFENNS